MPGVVDVVCRKNGRHLGGIWRADLIRLQRKADIPLKFQFHEAFLRVPLSLYAYLQQYLTGGSMNAAP